MRGTHCLALTALLALASPAAALAGPCAKEATKCITAPGGGDCASIGTWTAASRTCRLSKDLSGESIQIAGDDITLDGAGHAMTGASLGELLQPFGILIAARSRVTVGNLTARRFQAGIVLRESTDCAVTEGTLRDVSRAGIELV